MSPSLCNPKNHSRKLGGHSNSKKLLFLKGKTGYEWQEVVLSLSLVLTLNQHQTFKILIYNKNWPLSLNKQKQTLLFLSN